MSETAEKLNSDGLLTSAPDTIFTFTGRQIRPLAPDPGDISIEDIAHALSNQCRFTGHTRKFYSVAEHCILAAMLVPDAVQLEALLHDASEAYLADLARPIKKAPGLGEVYLDAEFKLEAAIAERFGTDPPPMSADVKWADEVMLKAEIDKLCHENLGKLWPAPEGELPEIQCWSPADAELFYLAKFEQYGGQR